MPHIVVEYSKNLGEIIEISDLVVAMHNALAAAGIDKTRIKTRAISCNYVVVGDVGAHGHMLHGRLLLMEGRDVATKKKYGDALYAVMKAKVEGVVKSCSVTLEIRDMNKDTYYS
jgi:5-carboxymethyl-2-hydroxymuconate isomerase